MIKGIVSEIIENEESQIYKLLNKSDQTVKDFIEKTGEIKSSITGVDQQTRNLISVLNNNQSRGQWAEFQVEDLLGIMEYKDGIHYETQKIMKSGTKPDFTFYLPDNKTIIYPNFLLVPLLAFNDQKYRLGYGGGFYDRTISILNNKDFFSLGIAFDEQETNILFSEKHDKKLNAILTPTRLIE